MGHDIQLEGMFHDKVLGVVAGDEHFWQCDQIGTRRLACGPCLPREGGIAGQITDGGVHLTQGDAKAVCHDMRPLCGFWKVM